jgi:hypothetical protein
MFSRRRRHLRADARVEPVVDTIVTSAAGSPRSSASKTAAGFLVH